MFEDPNSSANSKMLINAASVDDLLKGKTPEPALGNRFVILEVAYDSAAGGGSGACIPGSVRVHPSYFESFTWR